MSPRPAAASRSAAQALMQGQVDKADLYILSGGDSGLSAPLTQLICSSVLNEEDREFNLDTFDCNEGVVPDAISQALRELPVMCERRVLVLLNAQRLSNAAKKENEEEDSPKKGGDSAVKRLAAAFQEALPYHTTTVILVSESTAKDSLAGKVSKGEGYTTAIYDCTLQKEECPTWIGYQLQQLGRQGDSRTIHAIAERTGTDVRFLQTQLQKLSQYMGERTQVTDADIRATIRLSAEMQSWQLTDAIRKKDRARALSLIQDFFSEDGSNRTKDIRLANKGDNAPASIRALGMLSYINTYLRSLAQLRHLTSSGVVSLAALATQTGKKEFQVRKNLEELDTWSDRDLRNAFTALCLADYSIKHGRDHLIALQLVLTRLCLRRNR